MPGVAWIAAVIVGMSVGFLHPGGASGESLPDAASVAGICARCHEGPVTIAVETGGHAEGVLCDDCHQDRRSRRFGRRHRTVVSCASHHDEMAHPARARAKISTRGKRKLIRNCTGCHEPHGAANASLVRDKVRARRRPTSVRFDNGSGAAPGGFTDPEAPGTGLCEICHRRTAFYRRDGSGQPHFTVSCTACHRHEAGFEVGIEEDCSPCHDDIEAQFAKPSLHSTHIECGGCHEEVLSIPGSGHRLVPDCEDCHEDATHTPPGQDPFLCTQCHDPHGTDNIKLIVDEIRTVQDDLQPITFESLTGRADGSFASASTPGSGICEVCHTITDFYQADGSGETHFETSCVTCHRHSAGFSP